LSRSGRVKTVKITGGKELGKGTSSRDIAKLVKFIDYRKIKISTSAQIMPNMVTP
jgi:hypothetical protein